MGRKRKAREGGAITTLTSDVSNILRAINTNGLWKNSTTKLNKTTNKQNTLTKANKKNVMTEEDIDKLFSRSKSKNRTECLNDDWKRSKPIKDFANSVKFLKVDD